jgi:hypothetical protein
MLRVGCAVRTMGIGAKINGARGAPYETMSFYLKRGSD